MKFEVRRTQATDAEGIVRLFSEGGNLHNWSVTKWRHYYEDYPEGKTVGFVAVSDRGIIGHYGLFPVTIGTWRVYLGVHAYVSESVRGLAVISSLMRALDEFCMSGGVPFIVGFSNPRFTTVKNKLFRWKTPFSARFVPTRQFDPEVYQERPFRFQYTGNWQRWRFGQSDGPFISQYKKVARHKPVYQLLHTQSRVVASDFGIPEFECWDPEGYLEESCEFPCQPFSIKIYDKQWSGPDLLDPENWFIQMGDSDTFVFKVV